MQRIVLVLALVGAFVLVPSVASAARVCTEESRVVNGVVVTTVVCHETDDEPASDSPAGGGGRACTFEGRKIPCTENGLTWFSNVPCYARNVSDDYDRDHPSWEGNENGSIWQCSHDPAGRALTVVFWVDDSEAPPPPDPRELAEEAFGRMQLATPSIHVAPAPPLKTYVGLDTWLWMDRSQWATLTNSVTVRDTEVDVTARVVSARWDMGAGSVGCPSAGRPWVKGLPDSAKTDCSYTYKRVSDFEPDKKFRVSVHLQYQVDWVCSGECLVDSGTLGLNDGPSAGSAVRVGERQSVVID